MDTQIPRKIVRKIIRLAGKGNDIKATRRLESCGEAGAAIARSIRRKNLAAAAQDPVTQRIEMWRKQAARRHAPLVDNTLGPPAIYDDGKTVAEALTASRRPRDALTLYNLVTNFQPKTIVELGTNLGISSAYLAAAQRSIVGGQLTTFDASPYRQRLAKELHATCDLKNIGYVSGLFADTLSKKLAELPPVNLAFIDGHHQYQPTLDYFDAIHKHAADHCVFIFDDINWSSGMEDAWAVLKRDDRFSIVADLRQVGICVLASGQPSLEYVSGPISTPV